MSLDSPKNNAESTSSVYDALVYQLFQPPRDERPSSTVLVFTSANSGEGVTSVVAALVESAQIELGVSAIHIDMDWLKAQPLEAGLEKVTSTSQAVASGWSSGWEQRRLIIDQLRTRAQIVAIDCPALSASSDVLALANIVDGVVLIVEADKTLKSEIRAAESRIEASGGNIVGLILNKRRSALPKFLSRWFPSNGGGL